MSVSVSSNKAFNAALFTEAMRKRSFTNMLTEGAPKQVEGKKAYQTSQHMPIVRVTDLEKTAGEEVEVDIVHQLSGKPTMGDKKLEGRGENITSASMSLKINQGRHMVDTGGKMAQQRTKHDIQRIARGLLGDGYYRRLTDETTLYHLAGARGTSMAGDLIVPLASDPEFSEILVNEVTPPTFDRHMFGGDATSIDTLDASDIFSLEAVENMAFQIDTSAAMRMQPIKYESDMLADEDELFILYVSPTQMYDFKQSTSGKDMREMMAQAQTRLAGFKSPVFRGECFYWDGILIKKMDRYIEHAAGATADFCTDTNAAEVAQATFGVKSHRSILLGGQALAYALGQAGTKGGEDSGYFGMKEVTTDHDNAKEISIRWMDGKKKIRFADKYGRINDHGVMCLDTAVSK